MHFVPVTDQTTLDQLWTRSEEEPVVLFKHDPICSISIFAYREMMQVAGEVPLIDVKRAHDLSQEVARRTGVKHESPQVIVLRNGRAVWSASHYAINADEVERAANAHD